MSHHTKKESAAKDVSGAKDMSPGMKGGASAGKKGATKASKSGSKK